MHVCLYWATLTLRESSGQDWETCGPLLLSGVSDDVVPCPWKVLPWPRVNMNRCYFLLLIIFKTAVDIFLKEQTSKSLKSKHLVAM